jgi:secreted trypsin-like serine protease
VNPTNGSSTNIVGGKRAEKGQFPWTVYFEVEDKNGDVSSCTGALIDKKWVLTAAHCIDESGITVTAYAGSVVRESGQKRSADKLIPHPNYNDKTKQNDIALFSVKNAFTLNDAVKTIPISLVAPSTKDKFSAAGFGRTKSGGQGSDRLLWVTLPFVTYSSCKKTYSDIKEKLQVCAGQKGKDTCQGDSGGALVRTTNPNNAKSNQGVVGVVSYGIGCGTNPGVYALASGYYNDFIVKKTGKKIPTITKAKSTSKKSTSKKSTSKKSTSKKSTSKKSTSKKTTKKKSTSKKKKKVEQIE